MTEMANMSELRGGDWVLFASMGNTLNIGQLRANHDPSDWIIQFDEHFSGGKWVSGDTTSWNSRSLHVYKLEGKEHAQKIVDDALIVNDIADIGKKFVDLASKMSVRLMRNKSTDITGAMAASIPALQKELDRLAVLVKLFHDEPEWVWGDEHDDSCKM